MDFLTNHDWPAPIPIAYGPGRIAEIAAHCIRAGMRKPLVVTDKGSATLPFIGAVRDHLANGGLESRVFSDISPNPVDTEIKAGCNAYRWGGHDGIIAIGGGSGMDGGKAIALTVLNGTPLWDFEFECPAPNLGKADFPPLICIPTTAGTGAESESSAMVTHSDKGMKLCIWHDALKPSVALLDPELTDNLPPHLTAWTGVDALVHGLEAYVVPDLFPLCDGAALEGLRLITGSLERAYEQPKDVSARGAMLIGSCMTGVAFKKGLGLVHAISHMIGAEFDTQHGLTNAIVLPAVLKFNASAVEDKVSALNDALGVTGSGFDAQYEHICDLLDRLGIPKSLTEIGVPHDCASRIAKKAKQDSAAGTNPRQATVREITGIIEKALHKGR